MKPLILATGNPDKAREIKAMLQLPELCMQDLTDFSELPEINEDGATFEENAVKKARTVAQHLNAWALADDSGLEVTALDGKPGIYSARYAGQHGNTRSNNKKLLDNLKGQTERSAQFVCAMALCEASGRTFTTRGIIKGNIIDNERGTKGFGYDPLFVPEGSTKTLAEMKEEEKNHISHRARALKEMKKIILRVFLL